MPASGPHRVLVIAEDPLARHGLVALLQAEPGLSVVAHADPERASELGSTAAADAFVWDLGGDPRAALATLPEGEGAVPIVALIADERRAAEVLSAGARAVLARDAGADAIVAAVAAVTHGLRVFDGAFDHALVPARRSEETGDPLTAREQQVVQLLSQGLSNKELAQRLGISEHTAKFHVNAILQKLGAQSRTDAVVRAARLGLVML